MSWSGPSSSPHRKPASQEKKSLETKCPVPLQWGCPAFWSQEALPFQSSYNVEIHLLGPTGRVFGWFWRALKGVSNDLLFIYMYEAAFRTKSLRIRCPYLAVCVYCRFFIYSTWGDTISHKNLQGQHCHHLLYREETGIDTEYPRNPWDTVNH